MPGPCACGALGAQHSIEVSVHRTRFLCSFAPGRHMTRGRRMRVGMRRPVCGPVAGSVIEGTRPVCPLSSAPSPFPSTAQHCYDGVSRSAGRVEGVPRCGWHDAAPRSAFTPCTLHSTMTEMPSPLYSCHDRRQVWTFLTSILEHIRKDGRHPSIRVEPFLFDVHRRPRDNQHLILVLMNGNVLDAPCLPTTLWDPELPLKRIILGVSGGGGQSRRH